MGLLGSRCVAVSLEVARSHYQNRVGAWGQPQLVPLPQGRAGSRCAIGDSTRAGGEEWQHMALAANCLQTTWPHPKIMLE